jgi:hypothetical protein
VAVPDEVPWLLLLTTSMIQFCCRREIKNVSSWSKHAIFPVLSGFGMDSPKRTSTDWDVPLGTGTVLTYRRTHAIGIYTSWDFWAP